MKLSIKGRIRIKRKKLGVKQKVPQCGGLEKKVSSVYILPTSTVLPYKI
jgi:hypothetical protein